MASRHTEDGHTELIKQLLEESGLVCIRPPEDVVEEIAWYEENEEQSEHEIEAEIETEFAPEEEVKLESSKTSSADLYRVFPTPSLRRVLPEKLRQFEDSDRIHVLPEEFKKDIDPLQIPKIATTPHQKYIDTLAEIVGCEEYKNSLAEYWFLDTLANLLRRAQEDDLKINGQAVLILWFCEWMKEIQYFDAADRERMLKRFKENMLAAARYVGEAEELPKPEDVGVDYKARTEEDSPKSTVSKSTMSKFSIAKSTKSLISTSKSVTKPSEISSIKSERRISFEAETKYECALSDLIQIIHYIYDLFSTDYLFDLVRSIFTFTPSYVSIDAPYQILNPKRMYMPVKTKPKKEKTPRKEKPPKKKKDAPPDTAEYIALMELKAKEQKELEQLEEMQKDEWNRRNNILPLSLAANDEFFNTYWPPPPPPPEPVVLETPPPTKGKGKPKPKGRKQT